mmetsp:Transcript_31017/g.82438  ORF Transcript_31017/g.82438 Transcript_31017/m.82438 type:complete len:152 (-) Transcript_31017:272-727(-)
MEYAPVATGIDDESPSRLVFRRWGPWALAGLALVLVASFISPSRPASVLLAKVSSLCGGVGEPAPADDAVQRLCDAVRDQATRQLASGTFEEFVAVSFATQVVAGKNYFVKVRVGKHKFVLLRIFVPLQDGPPELDAAQVVAESDPVHYID